MYIYHRKPTEAVMRACVEQKHVLGAAGSFIFCKDTVVMDSHPPFGRLRSGPEKYIFDCSAACMCVDLAATAMGFATCWIGNFWPKDLRDSAHLLHDPVIMLLVGYAEDDRSDEVEPTPGSDT